MVTRQWTARWRGWMLFGAVALACLVLIGPAQPAEAQGQGEEGVWITVGADAFRTLRGEESIRFRGQALVPVAQAEGVVLTQVDGEDLRAISETIHHAHRRCGGFMAHESLAEAQEQMARVARGMGAVEGAPTYLIDQPALVGSLSPQLSESHILGTIQSLSQDFNNRYYRHPSGVAGAEWIRDLWTGYASGTLGVTVELVSHSFAQPSVVLTIPGSTLADEVVVLGGHLDSIAGGSSDPDFVAPGADDNASGIAVISEVARVLLANGFKPQRTVKLMGYAAEEVGLRGSQDIAEAHATGGIDVVSVLQLDMTGFQGSTEDMSLIDDFTNGPLTTYLGQLITTYLTDLTFSTSSCGYACSDHGAWHFEGYPAAFVFEARFGQHNPEIHRTSDTLAPLGNSAAHALKFARLALAYVVETSVDGSELAPIFIDGFESGTTGDWTQTFTE
ncbi:MAG: M20/M25/M40 family metallo-hydrolase [Acidobacteriota bacterium]|nr:M20/M25/M40 family metallo-hydrolase [Acidobacteriota bacterium]